MLWNVTPGKCCGMSRQESAVECHARKVLWNVTPGKCCGMLLQKTWRFIGTAVMTENPAMTTRGHYYLADI